VFLYAFNGGFDKLFVLGDEEIGEAEFRFMNFNEVPRYYTAGLQVARRLIIPLCIVYMYAGYRLKLLNNGRFIFCCLVLLQLFASSLTMARAPFLMLLVGISFVHFITTESLAKKLILLVFYYLILVIMAGVITNLQYNITDFEYIDIFSMGLDFTSNRMLMVPTVVPINIVFSEFNFYSDPLLLKYSRIGGLLGLSVVGTLESDSIYVAPVGMIGDIYRNFNVIGVFLWGVFTGFLLNFIRDKWLKMSDIFKIIYSFAFIALIFYWTMGVVFSQGALMMLMTIFIFPIFVLKKFKF
jgi:oligosaccharide repeat unit polymerase